MPALDWGELSPMPTTPGQAGARTISRPSQSSPAVLHIAVVNNMPDAALRRTERQFADLLSAAADGLEFQLVFYSLPSLPRAEAGKQRLAQFYAAWRNLWLDPPDAIVVTGTEPREHDLRNEPYWSGLTALIDWIEAQAIPAMFSCLAAHAAVLHMDDVRREPNGRKCFGLFDHEIVAGHHSVMEGVGDRMWLPHSRWNQVTEAQLNAAGYQILSRCAEAGVGFFAKERKNLLLFCQGHPEYDGPNLLREYRRDVRRYLAKEKSSYPDLPCGYFTAHHLHMLAVFRQRALAEADESLMEEFPMLLGSGPNWDAWRPSSVRIFRNWLRRAAVATTCARQHAPPVLVS